MKTRRDFIKQGLTAGAALALSSGCGLPRDYTPSLDSSSIRNLRSSFGGQIILPGDTLYDSARRVHWRNEATDKRPALIARCARPDDVVRSVEYAAQSKLPIAVRGGGHSFVGWGTCDDGLVIDLSLMREIRVDPVNGTARVGGGVIGRDLVSATSPHGLVPVLGQCPTVGVAGLTLGGGLGWLSGRHGAACDNLLEAEIITAGGTMLTASAEVNQDLFWAIRGGGGNFGVATAFTYRLHRVDYVTAGILSYRLHDARNVLRVFGEVMTGAPDDFQATAIFSGGEDPTIHLPLCWSGQPPDGEEIFRRLRAAANPVSDTLQRQPYIETFRMYEGTATTFSALKGTYLSTLSDEAIDVVLESVARAPGPGAAIGLDHYMHGAVCRVPAESTAFELRAAGGLHVWITAAWNDASAGPAFHAWIAAAWTDLHAFTADRAYANYPGAEGEKAVGTVYRDNFVRIARIKNQYDPTNVFRRNFNITPRA